MALLTTALILSLSRAEIIERFRSPVITRADGLVQVYANCPEDMRREYQTPIARFAAETVRTLYLGLGRKPERFARAGIIIHIGDVRTNLTEVASRVVTNGSHVISRIYVKAPGTADIQRLRLAIIQAFYRSVENREIAETEALAAYRRSNPALRAFDERMKLEDWLAGRRTMDDEEGIKLMRRVFEPGKASARDILIFASRLYLYPPQYDLRFVSGHDRLTFSDALRLGQRDPLARLMAYQKALELPVLGGGRSAELRTAAEAYQAFLFAFAQGKTSDRELKSLLDTADEQLNVAFEKAR